MGGVRYRQHYIPAMEPFFACAPPREWRSWRGACQHHCGQKGIENPKTLPRAVPPVHPILVEATPHLLPYNIIPKLTILNAYKLRMFGLVWWPARLCMNSAQISCVWCWGSGQHSDLNRHSLCVRPTTLG